jgi:hypothetical protein
MPDHHRQHIPQNREPNPAKGRKQTKAEARKQADLEDSATIIAGEDPAEYLARVNAWMADYPPRNKTEELLVRHAVDISWKLDRAERQDNAILSQRVIDAIGACDGEDAESLNEAAVLASFDPGAEAERRRRRYFALHRDFLRAVELISKFRRL